MGMIFGNSYEEGSLSKQDYTATMDGDKITYFKDGVEVADPPEDVKQAFMSGDDEDFSTFGDPMGAPPIDFGKAATAIGKIGDFEPTRPITGSRPPSLPSMGRGRVSGMTGERPYPYAAPSYLAGSVDYNKLVGQLVNTLLKGNIRPRRINPLL